MEVDFDLCLPVDTTALPSSPQPIAYLKPEEEIARGPACWLWDYLRRCGEAAGLKSWTVMLQHQASSCVVITYVQVITYRSTSEVTGCNKPSEALSRAATCPAVFSRSVRGAHTGSCGTCRGFRIFVASIRRR